jgi:hypothetical protein
MNAPAWMRTAPPAETGGTHRQEGSTSGKGPARRTLIVVLAYCLAILPILVRHQFDMSAFIRAGDRFVEAAHTPAPIIVENSSNGYDGQFYYRLALSPFDTRPTAFGIHFDLQPYRMQRILYPLLVWAVTLGHARIVPIAMVLANLLGLACIVIGASSLTSRLRLQERVPLAIMLWPGFLITLSHDTTEIVAVALLVGALDAYFAGRLWLYVLLGGLAPLSRETTVLVLGGIVCFEGMAALRSGHWPLWRRAMVCALAVLPFCVWQGVLRLLWGHAPQVGNADLGWPLIGLIDMLRETLDGTEQFVQPHRPFLDAVVRAYTMCCALWLVAFCGVVAARVPRVLRGAAAAPLAAGWLPMLVLMSLLTAGGPWVDRNAYFRAFTECYVLGCLILAAAPPRNWITFMLVAGATGPYLGAWVLTIAEK